MRVLFWGTPEFAAPPLRALLGEGFDVVGVVTQPDRPQGRSRSSLVPPPIKQIAIEEVVPGSPAGAAARRRVRRSRCGRSSPTSRSSSRTGTSCRREVIDLPRLGTLNIHASLLPELRGAAPIQAAIRAGQTRDRRDDHAHGACARRRADSASGAARRSRTTRRTASCSFASSELGALALIEALALIDIGEIVERPQDDALATFAPKIERDDARIDWTRPAAAIASAVRAFDPKPGAFTTLDGAEIKLFGARAATLDIADGQPFPPGGTVLAIDDAGALVACGDGVVRIADAQLAGKRRLSLSELARGRSIHVGDQLGA